MTIAELQQLYMDASKKANAVEVVIAKANRTIALARFEASDAASAYNEAKAAFLVEHDAPNGFDLDLFGTGKILKRDRCKLDPPDEE